LTETVELSVSDSSEESVPFFGGKSENRPVGVLAVANTDLVIWQACYLDAVAVGEAQGTLNPAGIRTRTARAVPKRKSSHVFTSLNVI